MDYIKRLKKYFVGSEYPFESNIFRGKFSVKRVRERKLFSPIYDRDGKYDMVIDLTVDLKKCEWYTKAGYWYTPNKGFRKNKTIANRHLRTLITNEIQMMVKLLGVPHRIGEIKINWLHED